MIEPVCNLFNVHINPISIPVHELIHKIDVSETLYFI